MVDDGLIEVVMVEGLTGAAVVDAALVVDVLELELTAGAAALLDDCRHWE